MKRRRLVVLLPLFLSACGYNTIQTYDEQADAAQGQIEVQLQRRADLIGNLVNTVKGLAKQELDVFGEVARARGGVTSAVRSGDAEQMAAANATMTGALGRLIATVEAYPTIKSDAAFLKLQDELAGTENRVAVSRQDYNTAVQQYNTLIKKFPTVLTAKATGAKEKKYFQVSGSEAREVPKVDFGTPAAPAAPATPPTP